MKGILWVKNKVVIIVGYMKIVYENNRNKLDLCEDFYVRKY